MRADDGPVRRRDSYNHDMGYRIGCSGYFYRHWRGRFYPEELPMNRWFEFYARHFDTVEINASFYRFPTPVSVRRWRKQAPRGFVYAVKAPRLITHLRRFRDCEDPMRQLRQALDELGAALGMVLFQLPPTFDYSEERLERIVTVLPAQLPSAIEFRHASWWREAVWAELDRRGILFCSVHAPALPDELVIVGERLYLRFHGIPWYRHDYSPGEIRDWAERIRRSGVREAWIYFNNDTDAAAPRNALALRSELERERADACG